MQGDLFGLPDVPDAGNISTERVRSKAKSMKDWTAEDFEANRLAVEGIFAEETRLHGNKWRETQSFCHRCRQMVAGGLWKCEIQNTRIGYCKACCAAMGDEDAQDKTALTDALVIVEAGPLADGGQRVEDFGLPPF